MRPHLPHRYGAGSLVTKRTTSRIAERTRTAPFVRITYYTISFKNVSGPLLFLEVCVSRCFFYAWTVYLQLHLLFLFCFPISVAYSNCVAANINCYIIIQLASLALRSLLSTPTKHCFSNHNLHLALVYHFFISQSQSHFVRGRSLHPLECGNRTKSYFNYSKIFAELIQMHQK